MKKGLLTMLALLSMGSSAFAQTEPIVGTGKVNVPTVVRSNGAGGVKDVNEVSVVKNRQAKVKIELLDMPTEVEAAYRDLQFDLTLPAGITVTTAGGIVQDAAAQHTVAFNTVDETNNKVRFVVYNDGGEDKTVEKFADGIIIEIPVDVASDFVGTTEPNAYLDEIKTSDDDAHSISLANANFNVRAMLLGDVNDSGAIDIGDFVAIINFIIDKNNKIFVEEVSDVNGQSGTEIGDAVSVTNILIGSTGGAKEFAEEFENTLDPE